MPDEKSTGMPPNARTAAAERSMPGEEPEERRISDRCGKRRRRLYERSGGGLKAKGGTPPRLPGTVRVGVGLAALSQRVDIERAIPRGPPAMCAR